CGENVLDAIRVAADTLEERLAEAEREAQHLEPEAAGNPEMPELVHSHEYTDRDDEGDKRGEDARVHAPAAWRGPSAARACSRAQASAASASERLRTGPASCCCNTLSMTAAMLAKFSRRPRNAATAISFAAFSTAGIVPPARTAAWAILRHGNLSKSGSSNDNFAICTRSSLGAPEAMRSGNPSACAMGTRMSGWLICASTEPSSYSTSEWTMLCGWITTRTASGPTPNRWQASISSRPLFMSVAESTEIFGPMRQFGCATA